MDVELSRPMLAGGREAATAVGTLAWAVAIVSGAAGLLLVGLSLVGVHFSAWRSGTLVPGLVGAGMLGVAPGLFAVMRQHQWEDVRTLVWPVVVVTCGLFAVGLADHRALDLGRSIVVEVFALGWVAVLGALAVASLVTIVKQYGEPRLPEDPRLAPLPGWAKPLLAVLGAGWLGVGAALLLAPRFWGALLPFDVTRADAHALGVWALALGVGVLGALAEDDLARVRPALLGVLGIGVLVALVAIVHAGAVRWASGPGLAFVALDLGLVAAAVIGELLWRRRPVG